MPGSISDSQGTAYTYESGSLSESVADSVQSAEGPRKIIDIRKRGLWASMQQQIIATMATNLSVINYQNYALRNIQDGGTVLQVFTAYMVVGIPASYMQMVLGQFTHTGVFLLKRMAPIADGAGFSYCISILVISMLQVLQTQILALYLIIACVPGEMQWGVCKGKQNCWNVHEKCTKNIACVGRYQHTAAFVYWNETIMSGAPLVEERSIQVPSVDAIVVSLATWIIIYLLSLVPLIRLVKFLQVCTVFHLITKSLTAVVLLLETGGVEAFTILTTQAIVNLSNLKAWGEACKRVVVVMNLGDFSHVMMGALANDRTKIGTVSFLSGLLSFGVVFLDDVIINGASIALCRQANIPYEDKYLLAYPPNTPLSLTLMPTVFAVLQWTRLWNVLYFFNSTTAILFRVILNIHFLLEAVSHRFPSLSSYKKYSAPMFCGIGWGIGIVIQSHPAYHIRDNFEHVTVYFCQYFNVFFFTAIVSCVYGVRRFCDDIHFLRKVPPNLFWKISWMLSPVLLFVTISPEYLFNKKNPFFKERVFEIIFMFSPYLILTTIEVIKKIISRSTFTLITPEAKWGPKEIERRNRRRLFNPRKATRYMVGSLQCSHNCIVGNKALKVLVTKEAEIISRLGGAPRKMARPPSMQVYEGDRISLE